MNDFIFIRSIQILLPPYEKEKSIYLIVKDSKEDCTDKLKIIIIQNIEAVKTYEYSVIKRLDINEDNYVDQINFVIQD